MSINGFSSQNFGHSRSKCWFKFFLLKILVIQCQNVSKIWSYKVICPKLWVFKVKTVIFVFSVSKIWSFKVKICPKLWFLRSKCWFMVFLVKILVIQGQNVSKIWSFNVKMCRKLWFSYVQNYSQQY